MSVAQCPRPWRRAVLYDNRSYWYAHWYEICVKEKKKKRIHLYPVMRLKGLFWVTGSNSYCSSLLFCWALPGAAGLLTLHRCFSSTFIFSIFLFFHFSHTEEADKGCVSASKEGDSGRFNGYKQVGLMDINRLLQTALEETMREYSAFWNYSSPEREIVLSGLMKGTWILEAVLQTRRKQLKKGCILLPEIEVWSQPGYKATNFINTIPDYKKWVNSVYIQAVYGMYMINKKESARGKNLTCSIQK